MPETDMFTGGADTNTAGRGSGEPSPGTDSLHPVRGAPSPAQTHCTEPLTLRDWFSPSSRIKAGNIIKLQPTYVHLIFICYYNYFSGLYYFIWLYCFFWHTPCVGRYVLLSYWWHTDFKTEKMNFVYFMLKSCFVLHRLFFTAVFLHLFTL